jgi:beta-phosphoglucomutase
MGFKGAIFDLDGVLVDTVPLHFKAWKRMFGEYGKEFNFQDYKTKVDGIPRLDGARAILTDISQAELEKAAAKKQGYYLDFLKDEGVDVYQTSVDLIRELRSRGIKIAVISSSRNCHFILEKAGILKLIDAEVNGNDITKGKPNPQIFLMALERLGLGADECVVFEDAILGVEAAKRANITTVGVDRHRDPERLKKADLIVEDLSEVNFEKLNSMISKKNS